ncbi:DUF6445 family protein [Sphingosinicella sp. BN140058]|uniref:DUF6445 family protein n=1 Tax=Sphingosinicella sp. BN140058 TaxID=1892855 RepID=UPI001010F9F5|nr:DUF6445 family protein [Sphingosinicella sp. BN140058]QAY78096.1 hypothetical protein ETR14_17380 [Sphingosinicella sp. BN140058]
MKPRRILVGNARSPVIVVDAFTGTVPTAIDIAAALAPFPPPQRVHYPGLRRIIDERDHAALFYVENMLQAAAPFIGGGFGIDRFDFIEASFSLITTPPAVLAPVQRAPHFDSTDPNYLAVLHYLRAPAGSGTAFYRHRATGFERITEARMNDYVEVAKRESPRFAPGYIAGSNDFYEQTFMVEAVPDRLIIYQGSLLHSGIIPPGMAFSADPRVGRLTTNIFVQAY